MSIRVIFAPNRMLNWGYCANVNSPHKMYNKKGLLRLFSFEELIEKGLAEQAEKLFPKKNVTLIGYAYTQYNFDSTSYFPVQLVLSGKYQGIVWIKWKCDKSDCYYIFDGERLKDMETLPSSYEFCSDEENAMLFERFPQPHFADNLCKNGMIKYLHSPMIHIGATLLYELQRQLSEITVQLTGVANIQKYIGIDFIGLRKIDKVNGYSYSSAYYQSYPYWTFDKHMSIIIRWKSNTDKEYITPYDVINSNDITVEFSPILIPARNDGVDHIATKELLISYINSNPHKPNQLAEFA